MEYTPQIDIKNIPFQKYENNFTFIVDGKRYRTPRIVADLLSPKIRRLHFVDETINEFCIETNNNTTINQESEDYFEEFLQIFTNDHIILNNQQKMFFTKYFSELGNTDECIRIQSDILSSISTENAIDQLLIILNISHHISDDISIETSIINDSITFISKHFEEISKEKLKLLPIEFLKETLNSNSLQIVDEDSLFSFILSLYSADHSYSELFECVIFSNVSKSSIDDFVEQFEFEDMNSFIWSSICERLQEGSNNSRFYLGHVKEFSVKAGHEFDGIMRYLTRKSGGNIHRNGTIEITSSSILRNNYASNLVDYDNDNCFWSNNDPDVFVCFDFKERGIQLTDYSVKSNWCGENCNHLRNWAIEGSSDGEKWKLIDEHSDDPTMNGEKIIHSFKVEPAGDEFYRFIRLRQTGYSWYGYPDADNYYLTFYFIEFFGKIREK